jgi:hypothetical protein
VCGARSSRSPDAKIRRLNILGSVSMAHDSRCVDAAAIQADSETLPERAGLFDIDRD